MNSHNQNVFVVRPIEDPNVLLARHRFVDSPQEVVIEFHVTRLFERHNLAALGIDARHHGPNRAIFASRIHPL